MTLAEDAIHTAPPMPTPAEMIDAALAAPDGRAVFYGVPWSCYESLLEAVGNGLPRLNYDDGDLELVMPDEEHDSCEWVASRFVEAYMDEFGIDYRPMGHTTLRDQPRRGGLEPDGAYYVQNVGKPSGGELNLAVDPPPDLAIEIDISPPTVRKSSIYARLGVPEIWRWRRGRLTVLEREPTPAGGFTYAPRERSIAFPDFPLAILTAELGRSPNPDRAKAARAFREWCRTQFAATLPGAP